MSSHAEPVTKVTSADGTEIAYWTSGDGPPLLLVHGAVADHTRFQAMLPFIEPHATAHAMDRRGRGGSGDAAAYSIDREYEDVAAVIDSIAGSTGEKVDVYGHSHGGFCAFGAAALTSNIRKLVMYEGWPAPDPSVYALPPETMQRMDALMAAGDREGVIETVMSDVLELSAEEIEMYRTAPSWPGRVAAAHTITREIRVEVETPLDPAVAAKIDVPALLLTGADSPEMMRGGVDTVAAKLPDARIVSIEGQQHIADLLAPEIFFGHVFAFLREEQ